MKNRGRSIILQALLWIATGCVQANTEPLYGSLVFVCDLDKVYQDTLYLISDKVNSPTISSMCSELLSFRYTDKAFGVIPSIDRLDRDTLTVAVKACDIVVTYRYNPLEKTEFVAHMGDTVFLSSESGECRLNGEKSLGRMVEYDVRRRERYGSRYGWNNETLYDNMSILNLLSIFYGSDLQNEITAIRGRMRDNFDDERIWLDSLWNNGNVSNAEYTYYGTRLEYARKLYDLSDSDTEYLQHILRSYSDAAYINDSYGFYGTYMNAVVHNLYYTKMIDVANGQDYDYRQIFTDIYENDVISGRLKEEHIFQCLMQILESLEWKGADEYYEKALNTVKDTSLLRIIEAEYYNTFPTVVCEQSPILLNVQGDVLSFEDMLKQYVGKVVYCEIWASWCEPCRKELPNSQRLEREFSDQDIAFLYLAYNDKEANWKKAMYQLGIESYKNHYLIAEPRHTQWTDIYRIETIPRYFIFDKGGNLVNADAPSPSSESIREILMRLVK